MRSASGRFVFQLAKNDRLKAQIITEMAQHGQQPLLLSRVAPRAGATGPGLILITTHTLPIALRGEGTSCLLQRKLSVPQAQKFLYASGKPRFSTQY